MNSVEGNIVRLWSRYVYHKVVLSTELALEAYKAKLVPPNMIIRRLCKNLFCGPMTIMYHYKGEEMAPTFSSAGASLLVRPIPHKRRWSELFVGDVVLLKDPGSSKRGQSFLVRRIGAMGGDEMLSNTEDLNPFVLPANACWVMSDNTTLPSKEAKDSRNFGPVHLGQVIGRAIYFYESDDKHGAVENSEQAENDDSMITMAELDIDNLSKICQ